MSRLVRLAAAVAVLVGGVMVPRALGLFGTSSSGSHSSARDAGQVEHSSATQGVIKHVIVVIQSHHSFDNYFGTRPGVDGLPANVCVPVKPGSTTCVKPFALTAEESRAGLNDSAHSMARAVDGGKMDGFVAAQANAATGTTAMGYYQSSALSYYTALANHYTLFDHFFAAAPGGSLVNRLFAIAGQAGAASDGTAPTGAIAVPTIFDELQRAGLSWKFYVQNYQPTNTLDVGTEDRVPLLATAGVMGNPAMAKQVVDVEQYFQDLQNGDLPAVSYVASSVDSERPPQNPNQGQAFVRSLVDSLMQNKAWSSTAIVLTYDDAGGWYDHVAPPTVTPSAPGLYLSGAAQQLGLRVPTILISPYARAGVVDHTQMDTTSILRLIEQNWNLSPLTARDATAASLSSGLNLSQAPLRAQIASASSAAQVVRPHVLAVYALYLAAFAAVIMLVLVAVRSERRALLFGGLPVRSSS